MENNREEKIKKLKKQIRSYADFPKKGILFWDVFSALSNGATCELLQELLVDAIREHFPDVQALVGLEARGFLFAFSLAQELKVACIPARKKNKLPGKLVSYKYQLEYGEDTIEVQKDSITPGLKCVIVDDLIATGGTLSAVIELLNICDANILGALVVMELVSLNGRRKTNIPVHSLIQYE